MATKLDPTKCIKPFTLFKIVNVDAQPYPYDQSSFSCCSNLQWIYQRVVERHLETAPIQTKEIAAKILGWDTPGRIRAGRHQNGYYSSGVDQASRWGVWEE